MALTKLLLPILLLIGIPNAFSQSINLDTLIGSIFNTSVVDNTGHTIVIDPIDGEEPTTKPTDSTQSVDKYKSCGQERECVPRFLCKNDQIVDDGTDIIDIRASGVECSGYLEVCCDVSNKVKNPVKPPVPVVQHVGCGYRNPEGVGFRISGATNNEAQFGEFPWMVAIVREEPAPEETLQLYECGGALIAPTVIITAAHCVKNRVANPNILVVRAGEWDTQTMDEILPFQDRRVIEIILHEKFHKGSLANDIALLFVDIAFDYKENIRPICLPPPNFNFDLSRCYAMGWGKDKFGKEGTYQVILKKVELPIVPRADCQPNLRKTRLGGYFNLHASFICAGGEAGIDTCNGDGGSPLICPTEGNSGQFYQAGIVAWGIGCGEVDVPGVYASVAYLRPWINEKLSAKGIDFSAFTP